MAIASHIERLTIDILWGTKIIPGVIPPALLELHQESIWPRTVCSDPIQMQLGSSEPSVSPRKSLRLYYRIHQLVERL